VNPKEKTIIISIICGLAFLVLIIFALYPLLKNIKKNSEEFISVKKELILTQRKTAIIEENKETYRNMEPDLKKMDGLFVDPEIPIDLIRFWEKTAVDSKALINISLFSLAAAETEPWGVTGFQIRIESAYADFLKFLDKIENGPYLVKVQNLMIKKLIDEPASSDINVTLSVKVFSKKDENKK